MSQLCDIVPIGTHILNNIYKQQGDITHHQGVWLQKGSGSCLEQVKDPLSNQSNIKDLQAMAEENICNAHPSYSGRSFVLAVEPYLKCADICFPIWEER